MRTTRRVGFYLFAATAALLLAGSAVGDCQDMRAKAQRGFANMVGGVVEIPGCVADTAQKKGPWFGYSVGLLKGIGMVPVRTVVGIYEFLTFYVPAPADYEPVLKPATPFNYWDAD
ncbi:MAG: exosortase system-associated protein, TIGR04073 family [Verrucomicrobia bacterium]|nr:exosortase system-associated protein, TIGR04073 family [Verrucomicrobiota bacterium]